jgi:purine nucleosidase
VTRPDSRIPVILDTDIGTDVDDAYALILAATLPQLDLKAVTTVLGDTTTRARLARKLLSLLNRPGVLVSAGAPLSLTGESGWWGGWEGEELQPDDDWPISTLPAPKLICKVLADSDEPVTVICIGALTNLALAARDPGFRRERIDRVIVMGGALSDIVVENTTVPPHWETNLHNDIDAAVQILRSGVPVILVPADITFHAKLRRHDFDRLRALGNPISAVLVRMSERYCEHWQAVMRGLGVRHYYEDAVALLHDPLAVLVAAGYGFADLESADVAVTTTDRTIVLSRAADTGMRVQVAGNLRVEALSTFVVDHICNLPSTTTQGPG